jgi:hypothetical protein
MSVPAEPGPQPGRQSPPPAQPPRRSSPWGAVLVAVLALGLGVVGGLLIAGSDNSDTETVTKKVTTAAKATTSQPDVTVSVPTQTTTVEKTITVTTPRAQTTDTNP